MPIGLREFMTELASDKPCMIKVIATHSIVVSDLIDLVKGNCIVLPNLKNILIEIERNEWTRCYKDGQPGTRLVTIRKGRLFDVDWFVHKMSRSIVDFGPREKFARPRSQS